MLFPSLHTLLYLMLKERPPSKQCSADLGLMSSICPAHLGTCIFGTAVLPPVSPGRPRPHPLEATSLLGGSFGAKWQESIKPSGVEWDGEETCWSSIMAPEVAMACLKKSQEG